MRIEILKETIASLKSKYGSSKSASLLDKILTRYCNSVLNELTRIIKLAEEKKTEKEKLPETLTQFLKQNWELVQGTSLCYTAIPNEEITLLLCDVATFIASQKESTIGDHAEPIHAIKLLMPSVVVESHRDAYPDLHAKPGFQLLKMQDDPVELEFTELSSVLDGLDGFVWFAGAEGNQKGKLYFVKHTDESVIEISLPVEWSCAVVLSREPNDLEKEQVADSNKILFIRRGEETYFAYCSPMGEYTEEQMPSMAELNQNIENLTKEISLVKKPMDRIKLTEKKQQLLLVKSTLETLAQCPEGIIVNKEIDAVDEGGNLQYDEAGAVARTVIDNVGKIQQFATSRKLKVTLGQEERRNSPESIERKAKFNELKTKCKESAVLADQETLELIRCATDRLPNVELQKILQTHILGEDGRHLIPIRLLTEITLAPVIEPSIIPYMYIEPEKSDSDEEDSEAPPVIPKNTMEDQEEKRLIAHSALTQEFMQARKDYTEESNDKNTLLGRLTELCTILHQNSAYVTGVHDNAAAGAYPAIIVFMEYYNRLSPQQKGRIPGGYKLELMSSLPSNDRNQAEDGKIYLSSEGRYLVRSRQGNIQEGGFDTALMKAANFADNLRDDQFLRDIMEITSRARHTQLESLAHEIELLRTLTTDKTKNVNATANIATCIASRSSAIKRTMGGHEALLGSISLQPSAGEIQAAKDRFETAKKNLLQAISLSGTYVGRDLLINNLPLLSKFPIQELLSIPPKTVTLTDFQRSLESIPQEQHVAIFEVMQENWQDLVKDAADLKWVLDKSNASQKKKVFQSLTPLLPGIIQSVSDFRTIKDSLLEEQHTIVFNQLKSKLIQSITTANDFRTIRPYLTSAQCAELLATLETKAPDIWTEINCETLVTSVKDAIINNIHPILIRTWTNYKQQEVNALYPQRYRKVSVQKKNAHGQFVYDMFNRPVMDTVNQPTNDHLQDREREMAHYRAHLNRDLAPQFRTQLINQIEHFSPGAILNGLFKRHPWMRKDPQNDIVKSYLDQVLNENLLSKFTPPLPNWPSIPMATLDNVRFQWRLIDAAELTKKIEGHPLSKVQEFYLAPKLPNFPSLDANVCASYANLEQWLRWRFTRLDLLRLMARQYPTAMNSTTIDGVSCTNMAPLLLNELQHLSSAQLKHSKTLLINIGTEYTPTWITLQKNSPDQWIAYVPPNVPDDPLSQQCQASLTEIRKFIPSLTVESVNYQSNVELSDIEIADPVVRWHIITLGRILPKFQYPESPMSTYRANVPLPLMLQHILVNCISKASEYPHLHQLTAAFGLRSPFTEHPIEHFTPLPASTEDLFQFDSNVFERLTDQKQATVTLGDFDRGDLLLNKQSDRWSLQLQSLTDERLINAFQIIYHHPVSTLLFTPSQYPTGVIDQLFSYDIHLTTIKPLPNRNEKSALFQHASHCAARNRFLAALHPERLTAASNNAKSRHALWTDTGKNIADFFQDHHARIDLDFVHSINQFNLNWRNNHCDNALRGDLNDTQWGFLQIAQMGTQGLNELFKYLEEAYVKKWEANYKEPAPNLRCTLDLAGCAAATDPLIYIQHLSSKIRTYDPIAKGCTPLFKALSLILPQPMTLAFADSLLVLLDLLNQRKSAFPSEVNEVVLYNLNIDNTDLVTSDFIARLTDRANTKGFALQIRLPDWDRAAFEKPNQRKLKADYRALQNQILDNQRTRNAATLIADTENSYALKEGRLRPEIVFDSRLAQELQPWDQETTWYPLTAQSNNIQHQMEQQQEQQQEEKTRVVPIPEPEDPPPQILLYSKPEASLITRENIHSTCLDYWKKIDPTIRSLSSSEDIEDLSSLFSLWVGSKINAEHVIEKIEPVAMQKIMQHASKFRLGLNKDNLPAGFYLARSSINRGFILCFDHEHERKDLLKNSKIDIKRRNPFTIELDEAKPVSTFRGDFRQLLPFCHDLADQQAIWNSLATEDTDNVRLDNAVAHLHKTDSKIKRDDASVTMQRLDAFGVLVTPQDRALVVLQNWARQSGVSPSLEKALFDPLSSTRLNKENLKSLGQLFNHFDAKSARIKGAQHWLHIAQQLFDAFGAENFAIWKKWILDPSQNWSEHLKKEEVDTVAMSIITLKKLPAHQRIWWQLVETHGKATGPIRYAKLWFSYQKFLKILSDNSLVIDEASMLRYLTTTPDFNGYVFFDRLCETLKKASHELHGQEIAQNILNNIDKIDWHHNGFYYANHYDGHSYWDEILQLSDFRPASKSNPTGYIARWTLADQVELPVTQALRFASHRTKLYLPEFERLKKILMACCKNEASENLPLRLLSGCLAIGVDSVANLNEATLPAYLSEIRKINPELLRWLNSRFYLDGQLKANTIQLRWEDIVPFATAMSHHPDLQAKLLKMEGPQAIEFLNQYGRALQCYHHTPGAAGRFEKLLTVTQQSNFAHPFLTTFPWLIEKYDTARPNQWISSILESISKKPDSDGAKQVALFQTQLQSMRFDKTTYWPDQDEVAESLTQIACAINPREKRREIVAQLAEKGVMLAFQELRYCPVSSDLTKQAVKYLDHGLKGNFKSLNFPLCKQFIKEYVALETEGNQVTQLNALMKLLIRLDNKPHYNELGQILGLLMQHANTRPKRYYSAPQLCAWLNCFLNDSKYQQRHYPIDMLKALLASTQAASLCNHNLDALQHEIKPAELRTTITEIAISPVLEQYKSTLVKLALQPRCNFDYIESSKQLLIRLQQSGIDSSYLDAIDRLIFFIGYTKPANSPNLLACLTQQANDARITDAAEQKIWQKTQITLINRLLKESITAQQFNDIFVTPAWITAPRSAYRTMIFVRLIEHPPIDLTSLLHISRLLVTWDDTQLKELARYYATEPRPSVKTLHTLLSSATPLTNAADLIHQFESVEQAKNKTGQSKRHYSISKTDHKSLLRVLAGIKRKGQGYINDQEQKELLNLLNYTNSYAQVANLDDIRMPELLKELHAALAEIKKPGISQDAKNFASARLLACMREILLRKSGKWANHTQMLDLLYAAVHNDNSLLHQLQTGQGKSIITVMRTAYLALNGSVVDVFSAKDSLSRRDHEEFAPVLDAMGIRNGYITANSEANAYHDSVKDGIGAVNYCTMGNFSLFISHHIWKGVSKINLDAKNRVAFLDEADHVLDEQTQFNFSDNDDGDGAYNLDEWVYQAVAEFYQENKNSFPCDPATNIMRVSNIPHLKTLCEFLQKRSIHSPEQSKFIERFITPAITKDPAIIKKRDNQLLQLLTANHTAQFLREGVGYCIRPETKKIGDIVFNTRFAKVMIENQIREGSTYSDLVQQFLHVRLNKEAVEKGEKPDFFVEPTSQIALSQNVTYLLNKYYSKLEGCTGTVGNKSNQARYTEKFGIEQFIKLPTHEERRSEFFPTEYHSSEDAQVEAIAKCILQFPDRPLLITCEDDIAVKHLSKLVREKLLKINPLYNASNLIIDTNDSGKDENEVVPLTGRAGVVTFSGRMGRGTDIRPETEHGLMVIRSYPTRPSVAKQEHGRQGRNGEKGTCIDILNYAAIEADYKEYSRVCSKRLTEIMAEQTQHLDEKLAKYKKLTRKIPRSLEKPDDIKRYLITRATEQLKYEIKKEYKMYIERKNHLIATLSGNVMDTLQQKNTESLRTAWIACRKQIDLIWNRRLAGNKKDSEEVYSAFIEEANKVWQELCSKEPALKPTLINELSRPSSPVESASPADAAAPQAQNPDMPEVAEFYQNWVEGAENAYFNKDKGRASKQVITAIYGSQHTEMNALYQILKSVSADKFIPQQKALFTSLQKVMKNNGAYAVPFQSYITVIQKLVLQFEHKDYPKCLESLEAFFAQRWLNKKIAAARSPEEIKKIGILLKMIMTIVTKKYERDEIGKDSANEFIKKMSEVIQEEFWHEFDENFATRVESVFASDANIASLLTSFTNKPDLQHCVATIHQSRLMSDTDEGVARRNDLCQYLTSHAKELSKHPQAITPLFSVILVGRKSTDAATTLPKPLPEKLPEKDAFLAAFWNFLAQRSPLTEENTTKLLGILTEHKDKSEFLDKIMKELNALSPYIPLDYINKELLDSAGRFNINECHLKLKAIKAAGAHWCQFMASRSLIQSHHKFTHPEQRFQREFDHFLNCFKAMTSDRNQLFFEAVGHKDCSKIELDVIEHLATVFSTDLSVDKAQLQRMLKLAVSIQTIPNEESRDYLKQEFKHLLQHSPREFANQAERFENFVAVLNENIKPDSRPIPLSAVQKLWEKDIKNLHHLRKAIDVIQMSLRLNEEQNWAALFLSIDSKRKHDRQIIMQYLENDIVDIGDRFRNRCYDEYTKLTWRLPAPHASLRTSKIEERHQRIKDSIIPVMKLVREMVNITKNPFAESPQPARAATRAAHNLYTYFAQQEKRYEGYWWVNKTRRQQATDLFAGIRIANASYAFATHYHNALSAIVGSQQRILESDKNSDRSMNKKGYSRLYDISVQMFYKVATNCLQDSRVTIEEKQKFHQIFQDQLVFHIDQLHSRLESGVLKTKIAQLKTRVNENSRHWESGSTELAELQQALKEHRKAIPKTLYYLLPQIECACELSMQMEAPSRREDHRPDAP